MSLLDKNGQEMNSFQVRQAPKNKDISHKLPKRPEEKLPNFVEMSEPELLASMCSCLRLRYDPLLYRTDTKYKAKVDSILMRGMVSMMVDYLRKQGHNLEAVFRDIGKIDLD